MNEIVMLLGDHGNTLRQKSGTQIDVPTYLPGFL